MKGIRKRTSAKGDVTYQVQVRIKGAKPVAKSFKRLTDAKAWKQKIEVEIQQGQHLPRTVASKKTLAELIERYLKETLPLRKSKQSPVTTLGWWNERIGHLTLDKITTSLIKDHWEDLGRTPSQRTGKLLTPRTMNCYIETLSAMFRHAVCEYEWTNDNPISRIRKKRLNNKRTRFLNPSIDEKEGLSESELARFLTAVDNAANDYIRPATLISLSTGCRKGEVMELKWEQVDLANETMMLLDTKNGESRTVPIKGEALKALKQHAEKYRLGKEYVFQARKYKWKPGAKDSKPHEILDKPFNKIREEAQLVDFRWHDMRHSAATYMLKQGYTLAEIGKALGHKDTQSTQRYAHLMSEQHEEIVSAVADNYLGAACA